MMGNGKSTYELRADILRSMGKIDESLSYLKRQAELFPGVSKYWASVAETYKLKRDFDSSLYYINKAISLSPDVSGLHMFKAMYYAELKGDIATASSILKNASSLVDTSGYKPDFAYFEMLKGNYQDAILLTKKGIDSLGLLWQFNFVPTDLTVALLYHAEGKDDLAKPYFRKAYDLVSRMNTRYPNDFRMHAALGVALAGLGKEEDAVKEGMRAMDLMPVSKDAILGISPLETLALIYTLLDNQDAAMDILEELLQMPFGWTMSNSIPLYRMHYYWKPLQKNPRFMKMVEVSV